MVNAIGFVGVNMKNGDGVLRTRKLFGETKALSSSKQTGSLHEVPAKADIVGFVVKITGSLTGTLSSPKNIEDIISRIDVVDVNGESILEGINGSDLRKLQYWGFGEYGNTTALSNTDATEQFMIGLPIDVSKLPAKLQVEYESYSNLDSGATGGNASIEVWAYYRDGATDTTYRVRKSSISVSNGTNSLQQYLPRAKVLAKLGFSFNESAFSEVQFSRDGSEEYRVDLENLKAYQNAMFRDGYQAGLGLLDVSEATITDKAVLDYKASSSDTISLYAVLRD